MSDLPRVVDDCVSLFERAGIEYVLMGGIAVRVYGIPRATYDVDFTAAIERDRLSSIYDAIEQRGYTVPEAYRTGWVDEVAGMPVVKFRLYLEERGVDVDLFLAETPFQQGSCGDGGANRSTASRRGWSVRRTSSCSS
jgi:hypothetical protein